MTHQQFSDTQCNQEINNTHHRNQYLSSCPVRQVPVAVSLEAQICAQKALQEPEMPPESVIIVKKNLKNNEKLQSEGQRKKQQYLPTLGNFHNMNGPPLLAITCDMLPEIENQGLQNPLKSCPNKRLDSSTISRSMDLNFLGEFSMSSNISNYKDHNWKNNPFGNIAHTSFLPNTDCTKFPKMEIRHPVLTSSPSSSAIKSTSCESRKLEMLFESPDNSILGQSSKCSMFQMGDELTPALISGFRGGLGKFDSEIQNEMEQNFLFNQVQLISDHTHTEKVIQEFNSTSHLSDIILDSDLGLSIFPESKQDLLQAVVAGFPSSRKFESSSCSLTVDDISSQLGSSKEASLVDDNNRGGHPLEESTQISSSTELQKSTNANNRNDSTSGGQNNSWGHSEGEYLKEHKQEDSPKTVRKRGKPGELCRSRPKDRQQIQDRVRELRDVVPNANKCSIDALLERTIKYINFLHTVTQHVGRWSNKAKFKIAQNEARTLLPKEPECGASWAVDLDADGKIQETHCPIIVENLSQPGQMLVEILCEDTGIFLEIANNIRGLGLTILKGVMEVRNEHVWGRFVVEAVRDIHRVEVLWSLAHILELIASNSTNTRIPN